MRKLLVALCILGCAFAVYAQTTTPITWAQLSLENTISAGVYGNEIDLEFQPNPDFGALNKTFFYAGLGNPGKITNQGTSATFYFGVYSPKAVSIPMSLYTEETITALGTRKVLNNFSELTYSPKLVTSGVDTVTHQWVSQSIAHTYADQVLVNTLNTSLQGLVKVGAITVGLKLAYVDNNAASDVVGASAFFEDTVQTNYYDTAVATATPTQTLDYTTTTNKRNLNALQAPTYATAAAVGQYALTDTFTFAVPIALKTGNLGHVISIGAVFTGTDQSGSYALTNSARANALIATANDVTSTLTNKSGTTSIKLGYDLAAPAKGTAGNTWKAGVDAQFDLNSASASYDSVTRPYDLSVAGAKGAQAGGSHRSDIRTYNTTFDFAVDLSGSRVVDFNLGNVGFRFAPELRLGFSNEIGLADLSRDVSFVTTLDASGNIDGPTGYTRYTVTDSLAPASTFAVQSDFSLPMSVKAKPAGWAFSLLLGAKPSIGIRSSTLKAASGTSVRLKRTI